MDAYELPEEFSHLQAQDMGKIGFINDIVRGIKKVIKKETDTAPAPKENAVSSQSVGGTNMEALLKRGRIALEDGEYEKADGFFEEVLNINAECAEAYWGKVLAAEKCKDAQALSQKIVNSYGTVGKKEKLHACEIDKTYIDSVAKKYVVDSYLSEQEIRNIFTYDVTFLSEVKERKNQKEQAVNSLKNNKLLTRARQYATGEIKDTIDKMLNDVVKGLDSRIELAVKTDEDRIPEITEKYRDFLSAQIEKVKEMHQSALEKREADYQSYINRMELASTVAAYNALIEYFQGLNHYKDSDDYIIQCGKEIEKIGETERKESLRRKKVLKTRIMIAIPIVCVVLVASIIAFKWFKYLEKNKINQTYLEQIESLIEDENYDEVLSSLESTDVDAETVATAQELYNKSVYDKASDYLKDGTYLSAIQWFQKVEDYSNSEENILYAEGMMKYKDEDYSSALEYFEKCDSDYLDVADLITACTTHQEFDELCKKAEEKLENYDMKGALKIYKKVDGSDEDVANRIEQIEKYLKFSGNNNKMVYQRKNVKIVIKATLDSDDGFLDLIKYGSSIEYKLKNGKITFKEFGSKYTLTKKKIIKKYKLFSGDQIIEDYYRK
jgi:tetratricopeptide (TPR) repeat protein